MSRECWHYLTGLALLPALASSMRAGVVCSGTTSVSIHVSSPSLSSTDLYALYVWAPDSASESDPPFAMRTSATSEWLLDDLVPNTTYHLSVRSHPSSEPTIAWGPGWRPYTEKASCATSPAPLGAPWQLLPLQTTPASLRFSFRDDYSGPQPHQVGVRATEASEFHFSEIPHSNTQEVDIKGLTASTEYEVVLRRGGGGRASDPVRMRTSAADSMWTTVYRISEYSFDVDFLENHDSASVDALPLYLMTCDPSGNCAPWDVSDTLPKNKDWGACQSQLSTLCPHERGLGFRCLECFEQQADAVADACGAWSDQDTLKGFPAHWYCGLGWPESVATQGPITEYCVEHLAAPESQAAGYAPYLSCNSDEVEAWYTDATNARDPKCLCEVYDDRGLGQQTIQQLQRDCGPDVYPGWNFSELVCNCFNTSSPVPLADHPSSRYVGRSPVMLPYVGWTFIPADNYTNIPGGDNFSTPKNGSCAEGSMIGDPSPSGLPCTWKRHDRSRLLYGPDLLAAGWSRDFVPDTPSDVTHTLGNVAAFQRALDRLDTFMTPRCCGC